MMKLNLDIDYNFPKDDKPEMTNAEVTRNYLYMAVNGAMEQISGQKGRIWGRIQRKVDAAIDAGVNEIELETTEVDFLRREVFDKEPKYKPSWAKFMMVLEDAVRDLKEEGAA